MTPNASLQSHPELGRRSFLEAVGISRLRLNVSACRHLISSNGGASSGGASDDGANPNDGGASPSDGDGANPNDVSASPNGGVVPKGVGVVPGPLNENACRDGSQQALQCVTAQTAD